MNIVEAYTKFNGQLVIFISGLSGCGKTSLAKKISDKFNLELIDQYDYHKKNYDKTITLIDETEHINWSSDDSFDWDRLNKDINKNKKDGVVVTGNALVDDKIETKPDYHIHVSISKKVCMIKRRIFLEKNKEKYKEDYQYIDTKTESLKMNKMIYPYYLETKERSKISKYINANELTSDQIWDEAWNILIEFFQDNVQIVYEQWKKKHPNEDIDENKNSSSNLLSDQSDQSDLSDNSDNLLDEEITSNTSSTIEKNVLKDEIKDVVKDDSEDDGRIAFIEIDTNEEITF